MSMLRRFGSFVRKKPLLFDSLIFGSFYTSAEFLQQTYNIRNQMLEERGKAQISSGGQNSDSGKIIFTTTSMIERYNWPVIQRYVVYGYFMAGPILHGWYSWLDNFYKGSATKIVIKKLICDQFIFTPPLIVLFFTSMSWMEGRENLLEECKAKFQKTFQTSCFYWIPIQFVNFFFVSPPFRVAFVSIASFCWVNILCHLKRNK